METAEVLGPIAPTCTSPLNNQENADAEIRIVVDTITGGRFAVTVSNFLQIYSLKNLLAKKLNVLPDKICLLHKDCVLSSGTLIENGVCDLSTVRVFLSMETGTKDPTSSCSKKVGATNNEAAVTPETKQQDFFKCLEAKQFEEFLAGTVALTVAVKTENHTLLIQLKINSAITGQYVPTPAKNAGKSGTVVDRLEQIAPGVVQGAFSGTIPICSSPQGASFVPVDTVTDIVRDLVTFSAKAIGVPEVAASIANNAEQCISCCGFAPPDTNAVENVNPSSFCHAQQRQQSPEIVLPGNSSSHRHQKSSKQHETDSTLRKVEGGKAQKASRLSSSSSSTNRHRQQGHRRSSSKSSNSSSSCSSSSGSSRSRRSSGSSDKLNEVTRMKMSLLRAMLSK